MKRPINWLAGLTLAAGSPLALANQIDVLVFYTGEAASSSSGQDIEARIVSYVEHSNQAYRNSDVDVQLRLVGTEQVQGNYGGVDGNVLGRFRADREVARLRQQYGADLVALISTPQRSAGGYICGVGYQPGGNESTGQFYSNASAYAFSMTGVSCGYNTFTHELGHNMSLGHSHVQNSTGTVFPWGRGHGVSGLFSTVMAYPQSYGTRNHLAQFASPDQIRCEGQPCGSPVNRADGADAVTTINRLAAQIADFMPTAVIDNGDPDDEEPGNPGGGDNGGDNGNDPDLPVCDKPGLTDNNLIRNPDFNELSAWSSFNNAGTLTTASINTSCGQDNLLLVTDRTAYYGGAVQTIQNGLEAGAQYRVSAKFALVGTDSRDSVRISLEITDSAGTRFQSLPELSVTANELSSYEQTFQVEAQGEIRRARLLLSGPAEGVDFVADEVRLEKLSDAPGEGDGGDNGGDNGGDTGGDNGGGNTLILDESFENGGNGWSGYMGSWVFRTRTASEGNFGLASLLRMSTYSGPMLEATGLVEAGKTYNASFDVQLSNRRLSTDTVELWAWFIDDQGAQWQKLGGGQIATKGWSTIDSRFSLQSTGDIQQLRLHVMGAATGTRIVIDNFKLGL